MYARRFLLLRRLNSGEILDTFSSRDVSLVFHEIYEAERMTKMCNRLTQMLNEQEQLIKKKTYDAKENVTVHFVNVYLFSLPYRK